MTLPSTAGQVAVYTRECGNRGLKGEDHQNSA
jgi:hypothetical protein